MRLFQMLPTLTEFDATYSTLADAISFSNDGLHFIGVSYLVYFIICQFGMSISDTTSMTIPFLCNLQYF